MNKLNNAAANGGEEADEEEDADEAGIGVDNVVAPAEGVCGDIGVPGAAGNGVAADVAGVIAAVLLVDDAMETSLTSATRHEGSSFTASGKSTPVHITGIPFTCCKYVSIT